MSSNDWKVGSNNKSAVFIIPLLGGSTSDYYSGSLMPQCQFRNCFIGDKTKDLDNGIYLLYRFSASRSFIDFEANLEKHPLFNCRYEVDKKHTMFVFNVPDEFVDDYKKAINGQYSKMSDKYKEKTLKFHGLSKDSVTGGILYKSELRRSILEDEINKGIPRDRWTKIPLDVELEEAFNDEIEYFQEKYKSISAISTGSDF